MTTGMVRFFHTNRRGGFVVSFRREEGSLFTHLFSALSPVYTRRQEKEHTFSLLRVKREIKTVGTISTLPVTSDYTLHVEPLV